MLDNIIHVRCLSITQPSTLSDTPTLWCLLEDTLSGQRRVGQRIVLRLYKRAPEPQGSNGPHQPPKGDKVWGWSQEFGMGKSRQIQLFKILILTPEVEQIPILNYNYTNNES